MSMITFGYEMHLLSPTLGKPVAITRAPVLEYFVCVSQRAAADWLQVQLWQSLGKFLTPVPRHLDLSQPTLTDGSLNVKRYAFYSLQRCLSEEWRYVRLPEVNKHSEIINRKNWKGAAG